MDLKKIYQRRFGNEIEFRKKMWKVFCGFFQKYITEDSVVLDLGAGYCEFINNITAGKKIALDLNPDVKKFANRDVEVIIADCTNMKIIPPNLCDAVFVSSFFEHLTKENITKTLKEVHRVLKEGGRVLILQPNIRFCYREYWNFFDHITALDDRSLSEALETSGFKVIECRSKFLPYTTKSRFPKAIFLIKLYLRFPFLHYIFGKQAFICAQKVKNENE